MFRQELPRLAAKLGVWALLSACTDSVNPPPLDDQLGSAHVDEVQLGDSLPVLVGPIAKALAGFYLDVTPGSVTLAPGARQQFSVVGRSTTGGSWAVQATWRATGGSISPTGLYTAPGSAGTYRVMAQRVGDVQVDTATVTVGGATPPPAPPGNPSFWIETTPATVTLPAGGTQQFRAVGRDRSGGSYSVSVAWRATGGVVTSAGMYTAPAQAGTYRVIAQRQGDVLADTSVVTVGAGGGGSGSPSLVNECQRARAEWIWCDDFETDRLSRYSEVQDAYGRFVRQAGAGNGGSVGMRSRFTTAPQTSSGALLVAFGRTPQPYFRPVDAGTRNYREVYFRVFVRYSPSWQGGGGDKLMRAMSLGSSSTWAQSMIAHVWSGVNAPYHDYLYIDPASGTDAAGNLRTTKYNDFANLRWLGAVQGKQPVLGPALRASWHCIEARARLNDPGQSNGVFELWVDGSPDAARTGLNWVGSYQAYGINAVFLENYWNTGAPVEQERYFDNFVVSTARIGCS